MIDQSLLDSFNHCIDLLAAGQSVEDCLQIYPENAAQLEMMLEAGRTAVRGKPTPSEVAAAQGRVNFRFEQALRAPAPRSVFPLQQLASLAAALLLVCGFVLGGTMVAAQDSLPGDFLYQFKRLSEDIRLTLPGDDAPLQAQFGQRRIDETVELLALQREAEVTFEGTISTIENASFQLAGLLVQWTAETPGSELLQAGKRVQVRAKTTAAGQLIGLEIHPVDGPESPGGPPTPTITPSPTTEPSPTAQPSASPSPTNTPSPTETGTASPTTEPTARRTQTAPGPSSSPSGPLGTPNMAHSATPGANHSQTPSGPGGGAGTATENNGGQTASAPCTPAPPGGWLAYTMQSGDTLPALIAGSGTSVNVVLRANCLLNLPGVGTTLYLPPSATLTPAPTDQGEDPGQGSGGEDPGSGPGDGGDSPGPGPGGDSGGGGQG